MAHIARERGREEERDMEAIVIFSPLPPSLFPEMAAGWMEEEEEKKEEKLRRERILLAAKKASQEKKEKVEEVIELAADREDWDDGWLKRSGFC